MSVESTAMEMMTELDFWPLCFFCFWPFHLSKFQTQPMEQQRAFILQCFECTQHSKEMLPECAKQIIWLNPDLGNIYDRKMSKL